MLFSSPDYAHFAATADAAFKMAGAGCCRYAAFSFRHDASRRFVSSATISPPDAAAYAMPVSPIRGWQPPPLAFRHFSRRALVFTLSIDYASIVDTTDTPPARYDASDDRPGGRQARTDEPQDCHIFFASLD